MNHEPSTINHPGRARHYLLSASLMLAFGGLAGGCLQRSLSVTSEPAGAQLIVNGEAAGNTPAKLRFHHHGLYRMELRKSGYQPVVEGLRVGPKLYERMPVDFVTDVLWPGRIVDKRKVHYRLEKTPPFDKEKTLAAARTAAAEAEKVIPVLHQVPPPRKGARDRALVTGSKSPPKPKKPPKIPEREAPRTPKGPKPEKPAKPAKPRPGQADEPPPVPEIEAGRDK